MEENYLYHYTSVIAIKNIVKDKVLKVSNFGEKVSSIWFSKNSEWEPTATKRAKNNLGELFQLTKEQQYEHFGLARVCIKYNIRLTSWKQYKPLSKLPAIELKEMEKRGNPDDWYCRLKNVPSSEWESIELWDGMQWIPYEEEHPILKKFEG